ncbi:MAG: type II toxin-antitoxin system prevent-host-death family antitoxin [Spirochaetia bacterium]|jgi:prevent-host-death family protein
MIEAVTTVEARNRFSRLINRVAFGGERLVITRRDIELAALIPFNELLLLMQLEARKDALDAPDWEAIRRGGV